MATDPNPVPTDRTRYTLMGPTNHPSDHNRLAERVNELYLWMLNIIEDGGVGGGEVTAGAIADAVALGVLTPAAIGAMADDATVVELVGGRLRLGVIASDATPPPAGSVDVYGLTGDRAMVQTPDGSKTQLGPPWLSPFVKLGATADIATETLVTILTSPTLPVLAEYRVQLDIPYECAAYSGVLGGQLRNAFVVPGGPGVGAANSKGSWHGNGMNYLATGSTGTTSTNYTRRTWDLTLDLGGRGAGNPVGATIHGTLKVGTTAGTFQWKARRAASDAVTARIYGDNEVNGFGGASMFLKRVA